MSNLFYTGSNKFYIGHPKINTYMCKGQRGRGKTSYWLCEGGERALNEALSNPDFCQHKFLFLRRSEEQLKIAVSKGLFNGVWNIPNSVERFHGYIHERVHQKKIYLSNGENEIHVGYITDLNNVKGQSVEDSDLLIFDEFVEAERSKYKGGDGGVNEPELLARLDETLFRRRNRWIIMLGNFDSPTDPYSEYFGIPYNVPKWSNRENGIYYEVDYSEDTKIDKENTSVGKLWKGTRYAEYSNGNIALGSVDTDLICNKSKNAQHKYNVNVCGSKLTLWQDIDSSIWYVHDDYKFDNTKPIYTVMSKDMQVNGMFIAYNSLFLNLFRVRFANGMVRFNNQKTASLFNLIINLAK